MKLAQLIKGFEARLKQAAECHDYDEVQAIDAACLRFMQENLPPNTTDQAELADIMASLTDLHRTYGETVRQCVDARNQIQQELQTLGHNHRNTLQYLDIARNLS